MQLATRVCRKEGISLTEKELKIKQPVCSATTEFYGAMVFENAHAVLADAGKATEKDK